MNKSIKKGLVFTVIVFFVSITIQSSISATDEETDEYDKKYSNNIKTIDEYEEIITFIKGYAVINWIDRRGLFHGEVNLTWNNYQIGFINLSGFRLSESGIEYYNESIAVTVGFVYVYRFIGFSTRYSFTEFSPPVVGIALGNIKWS